MSSQMSAIAIAEPEYAPGRLVLFRVDSANQEPYVWCGRSIGWRPLKHTASMFFRLYLSEEDAAQAANKYVSFPLLERL